MEQEDSTNASWASGTHYHLLSLEVALNVSTGTVDLR